jgi:cell wall-associated NlpC family hydrolase
MLEEIQAALADICHSFGDYRTTVCRVEAKELTGARCTLAGTVLDEELFGGIMAGMAQRFPDVAFDAEAVGRLRTGANPRLVVTTNLASLHAEPSFRAEQMSQLTNGVTVERLVEQERWLFVRLPDGYLGWAYRPYLGEGEAPAPTHLVAEPVAILREAPEAEAAPLTRLFGGTAVHAAGGSPGWTRLELAGGRAGWLPAGALRSVDALPQDSAARREQMVDDAFQFMGIPYLWGGISALGIDCSGLVQTTHRLSGVTIPRDADMQFAAGRPVEPPFQPGDLLYYAGDGSTRKITHVAMSIGGWRVIHSSRSRNGVDLDDMATSEGDWLMRIFAGARSFLR